MKKLLLTLSMVLTLGLSVAGVSAQSEGVQAPDFDDLETELDVEGLRSVYSRTYSMDIEELMADPDFDFEEMDISAMIRSVSIQGMAFENDDAASAYLEEMKTELEATLEENPESLEGAEVSDLDSLDINGVRVSMDMPEMEMFVTMSLFVTDSHVFQVSVIDTDADTAHSLTDGVIQYILDAEVESDDVTFSEDGTSTGGVYDRMPGTDNDLVADLTSLTDAEIFLADE